MGCEREKLRNRKLLLLSPFLYELLFLIFHPIFWYYYFCFSGWSCKIQMLCAYKRCCIRICTVHVRVVCWGSFLLSMVTDACCKFFFLFFWVFFSIFRWFEFWFLLFVELNYGGEVKEFLIRFWFLKVLIDFLSSDFSLLFGNITEISTISLTVVRLTRYCFSFFWRQLTSVPMIPV